MARPSSSPREVEEVYRGAAGRRSRCSSRSPRGASRGARAGDWGVRSGDLGPKRGAAECGGAQVRGAWLVSNSRRWARLRRRFDQIAEKHDRDGSLTDGWPIFGLPHARMRFPFHSVIFRCGGRRGTWGLAYPLKSCMPQLLSQEHLPVTQRYHPSLRPVAVRPLYEATALFLTLIDPPPPANPAGASL